MILKAKKKAGTLKQNRNHSLWKEIYENNKNRMDAIAIEYRGKKITYRELFDKVDQFAMSLYAQGYRKGKELLACVSNSPEFIYLLLAASKLGLIFNSIGEDFDKDYLEEIVSKNDIGTVFITHDNYIPLKDVLNRCAKEVVCFSLADSLPLKDGLKYDIFAPIDNKFKSLQNRSDFSILSSKPFKNQEEFIKIGQDWALDVLDITQECNPRMFREFTYDDSVNPEDPFTVTYASNTSDSGKPEAILHSVKTFLLLEKFKKENAIKMLSMKNIRVMAHMPTYDFTGISSSIIEPLCLGGTIIPEPISGEKFFPYAVLINKPNMCFGSVGYWRRFFMKLEFNETFKNVTCPYLYIPIVTDEMVGMGEENFFNATARKHEFGVDKLSFPLAPVTFSIANSLNEFTGIFVTWFKAFQTKKMGTLLKKNKVEQSSLKSVDVEILDEDGKPVGIGEYGEIVVKSEIEKLGYYYNPKLNECAKRKDINGKEWTKTGTYGLKLDEFSRLEIKGRKSNSVELSNGESYPLFKIDDLVLKDTKNILSSSVVKIQDGDAINIVIHIEPQPKGRSINNRNDIIKSIVERLQGNIPEELKDSIFIRYRNTIESFPIAPNGKRNIARLVREGISEKCVSYREIESEIASDAKMFCLIQKTKINF